MLGRLERAFEQIVEGSIAGVFRLRVQPAEIGRRLERAMLDGRVTSVGATIAPNAFEVRLHPDDAASFADWNVALSREMERWLAELAFAKGIATVAAFRVRIIADPTVRRRSVRASARFDTEHRASSPAPASTDARPVILRLMPESPDDAGAILRRGSLTVGRAEDNDLMISDSEVSRHHARLDAHGNVWRAVDLESTNGTWVNGERISQLAIAEGDEVAFGRVRYTIVAE